MNSIALDYCSVTHTHEWLGEQQDDREVRCHPRHASKEIIGESAALAEVLRQVELVAPTDATALIQGETGTGKELIARALHQHNARRHHPFIKVNCAAMPSELLESELFGHERGAFTGAIAQKSGRFELAQRGTLFLDEVGDLPLDLQPKLLRVLQEQAFERVGGTRTIRIDVRLVASTHRDLAQMVAEGTFRSDLYYRLNVFPIHLPPLRERPEDIPLLVRHFAHQHAQRLEKVVHTIPAEALEALTRYPWPGNIRELQNVIERAVILCRDGMLRPALPTWQQPLQRSPAAGSTLADVQRDYILRVLRDTRGVIGGQHGAAARLGLKRTTLLSRMERLGIAHQFRQRESDRVTMGAFASAGRAW
jgi:formate hydrogenlyase transcriptional activator